MKRLGIVGESKVDDLGLGQGYSFGPEAFPGLEVVEVSFHCDRSLLELALRRRVGRAVSAHFSPSASDGPLTWGLSLPGSVCRRCQPWSSAPQQQCLPP